MTDWDWNDPDRESDPDPVAQGDLDGVLRRIDSLADDRDWVELERLRQHCLVAYERGHQLWPAANAAAYRLALAAPPDFAVPPVLDDNTTFTLGPLTEVVASQHDWADLDPHLPPTPQRAAIAQERIVRGDDLTDCDIDNGVFGTPLRLTSWEPTYEVATYGDFSADFPSPSLPTLLQTLLPKPTTVLPDDDVIAALRNVVSVWVDQSSGRAETVTVEGTAEQAIATLGTPSAQSTDVDVTEVLAHLAWAAASGGAQGRRRGMAAGRFEAWWAVAAATNLLDDWPVHPDDLIAAANELRWVLWSPGLHSGGWELHLAIEDPLDGLAWALSATDLQVIG